jgi:hypothetical protein
LPKIVQPTRVVADEADLLYGDFGAVGFRPCRAGAARLAQFGQLKL